MAPPMIASGTPSETIVSVMDISMKMMATRPIRPVVPAVAEIGTDATTNLGGGTSMETVADGMPGKTIAVRDSATQKELVV